MAKLFLSYAHQDVAIAERLARALEHASNHKVWWDRELYVGASFGSEIEQQLGDCDAVLVLWSPHSVQSSWVRDEAAIGRDAGKLIPIGVDDTIPPIGFRQFQTIGLPSSGRPSAAFIKNIEAAIERGPAAGAAGHREAAPEKRWIATRRMVLIPAVVAALLICLIAGVYVWRAQQPGITTIAVLPAAGGDAGASDYAESIASDLAAFLSAQGDATSTLDPSDPAVRNAKYRFSVGHSVDGTSVQSSLSLLARGYDGIIWSHSWSVPEEAAVDLKKQMSFAASRALRCALDAEQGGPHLSAAGAKLFIVGCAAVNGADTPLYEAAADLAQVVTTEPRFTPALEYLALARSLVAGTYDAAPNPPRRIVEAAEEAIAAGRRSAPRSGKVLLAEALVLPNRQWRLSLPLFDRAIKLQPNLAMSYSFRSGDLLQVGRMADAIADAEKSVQLDPLSPTSAGYRIVTLMYGGRFTKAKEEIAHAYRVWPDDPGILQTDFGYSSRYGDPRHAEEIMNKLFNVSDASNAPTRLVLKARENPTAENVRAAIDEWHKLAAADPARENSYVVTLGTFGKIDEALQLLGRPGAERAIDPVVLFRPEFDALRLDPRFMAVAAQFGLVAYWRSTGEWPDFCRDPDVRYDCTKEAAKYK